MPLFGLGVLILWLGWFGFNPGSTLNALDGRFAEIAMVTNLAAAAGVLTAVATMYWKAKKIDIGMAGNGAIAALVAITAPSGYVELWAAPIRWTAVEPAKSCIPRLLCSQPPPNTQCDATG